MLANQVSVVVHDLEQKRVDCLKTQQKLKRERENNIRTFKVCILIFLIYVYIHHIRTEIFTFYL